VNSQSYPLVAVTVVALAAAGVVIAVIVTGHTDAGTMQLVVTVLGFAGTIITVLIASLQVHGAVQSVGAAVNGRMDALVGSTSTTAFQAGVSSVPTQPAVVVNTGTPAPDTSHDLPPAQAAP
jgi:hypothetical protein